MNIKIDNNIPLPDSRIGQKYKNAIFKLEVGQSFEYPSKHYTSVSNAIVLCRTKNENSHFITKGVGNSVRRVWRMR